MIANATCSADAVELHIAEPEPMISVCSWCFPKPEDYFRAHPEHRGRMLTHTICGQHKRDVLNGTWRKAAR